MIECPDCGYKLQDEETGASELRKEISVLRAALEPFAKCAEAWPGTDDYNRVLYWARHGVPNELDLFITVGDLRHAAAAIEEQAK